MRCPPSRRRPAQPSPKTPTCPALPRLPQFHAHSLTSWGSGVSPQKVSRAVRRSIGGGCPTAARGGASKPSLSLPCPWQGIAEPEGSRLLLMLKLDGQPALPLPLRASRLCLAPLAPHPAGRGPVQFESLHLVGARARWDLAHATHHSSRGCLDDERGPLLHVVCAVEQRDGTGSPKRRTVLGVGALRLPCAADPTAGAGTASWNATSDGSDVLQRVWHPDALQCCRLTCPSTGADVGCVTCAAQLVPSSHAAGNTQLAWCDTAAQAGGGCFSTRAGRQPGVHNVSVQTLPCRAQQQLRCPQPSLPLSPVPLVAMAPCAVPGCTASCAWGWPAAQWPVLTAPAEPPQHQSLAERGPGDQRAPCGSEPADSGRYLCPKPHRPSSAGPGCSSYCGPPEPRLRSPFKHGPAVELAAAAARPGPHVELPAAAVASGAGPGAELAAAPAERRLQHRLLELQARHRRARCAHCRLSVSGWRQRGVQRQGPCIAAPPSHPHA